MELPQRRKKPVGVFCAEDYEDLCHLKVAPNLSSKLEKCEGNKCGDGFECLSGTCCPTKAHICSQPIESGKELVDFTHSGRFGFDSGLGNCIKFSYFGSEGNFNNFKRFQDCHLLCT
ncbi:unnamed protein product [Bursaphelenchus xylophilus]|uniref:(pine wood nematode) hypothetical protein n=1 Tax=Bursaphelenchus xylophilus TaxID=6326 RepID=A0A7I8XGP4_BURXY|nr:unnamed protein product [Bursaphelenchus xylophilus]CAG9124242.1 unnamed protein product [Bursaphelenchus xylophilus]